MSWGHEKVVICMGTWKVLTVVKVICKIYFSYIYTIKNIFKIFCPSDFARHPRLLDTYAKYKATEFRQFLLYTGPIVTYGILQDQVYKHFLFLHVAIRILVSIAVRNIFKLCTSCITKVC